MSVGPDLKSPRQSPKRGKGPIWFLLGGLVAVILVVMFPELLHSLKQVEHTTAIKAQKLRARLTPHSPESRKPITEPKLDFYQLLTRSSQVLTKKESAEVAPATPADTTSNRAKYIIQVASFRNKDDADTLKAQLALWGIVANVQSVTIKHENWERVRVGPMTNVDKVDEIQHQLIAHRIRPLLIKVNHK